MDNPAVMGGAGALLIVIVILLISGLITGAIARLVLPGKDPMSLGKTMLYGIVGSLLGGLISRAAGIESALGNVAVAVVASAALIWFFTRRKKTDAPPPSVPPPSK
jgi:uncharacterized membrane protein YeaQ/YmgE (transglycosylase-associated protein family)